MSEGNGPLVISGEEIQPGETRDLQIRFSESYLGTPVNIPVRVIRASAAGPRVFITGAIHGDELSGIGIIRELLFDQPPELLKGTLVCVPVVNLYGLDNHSRYLPDRRDLNRCFPGTKCGSPSSRLAHALFNEIILQCDYGIDFHTAAAQRTNYPNVRADLRHPAVRNLARMFGLELIVNSRAPRGSLRQAAVQQGIPTIILEGGEVLKIEPTVLESGMRGCQNVLRSLGMIDGQASGPPLFQVRLEKTKWVRASRGGFLRFYARPGDLVRKGEVIAANHGIFGREKDLLRAPVSGLVLGMTTMPAVKPGEPVYHLAVLTDRTFERVKKKLMQAPGDVLYRRVQTDLSTNVIFGAPIPDVAGPEGQGTQLSG